MSNDPNDPKEPGFLRRNAPVLTGTALSALAAPLLYKHFRRKNLSLDPAMRAIQEASGGKYTRVLPGTARLTGEPEQQSLVRKWMDRLLYAGGGDIAYKDKLKQLAKEQGHLPHIPGTVMHDLPGQQLAQGDVNLIANRASDEATSHFGNQDKWREYQIFNQFAPGEMGRSQNMRDVLHGLGYEMGHRNPEIRAKQVAAFRKQMAENPKARQDMYEKVQEHLRSTHGPGFMLKDVDAAATGGKFPTEKHDFNAISRTDSPESKTLGNIIRDPSSVMVQEKLPLEQGRWLDRQFAKIRGLPSTKEVRVHVMNGAVAPDLTVPRFSPSMFALDRGKIHGANDYVRDLMGKLPEELRQGTYALDIAPVHGGGYKLIESNPGYRSGLLNPQNYPFTGPLAHRQFTGQWSKPVSGIGAGLGAAALGTAGSMGARVLNREEKPQQPPVNQNPSAPPIRPLEKKLAALATKNFGSLTFKIDRPKGTVKKWPTKSFTYPCDYGYFPRLKGEDGEGLDAFVGDDLDGHLESFLKLKPDEKGRLVPDETKFILGLTDSEREKVYRLYGTEVVNRKIYKSIDDLKRDLERFKTVKKSRYTEKTAELSKKERERLENLIVRREIKPEDISLFERISKRSPVKILQDEKDDTLLSGGAFYHFGKPKHIQLHSILKNNPEVLGHEIGHAQFDKTLLGKIVQNRAANYLYALQKPIAAVATAGPKSFKNRLLLGAAIVGGSSLPKLISEHTAWSNAKKLFKEEGATPEQFKHLDKDRKYSVGTYYHAPMNAAITALVASAIHHQISKEGSLNARPSVSPGDAAGKLLWKLREEAQSASQREAESLRAAAVKTKKGKNIPPLSDLRGQAIKAAMDLYGVKSADLDKVLQGMTLFSDQGDATSPGHAHAAEASSKADKLDRVFKSFDDRRKEDVGQGTESSEGSLMQGSVIG